MKIRVQARLADKFEDIVVDAKSEQEAVSKAKAVTTLKSNWTRFVI